MNEIEKKMKKIGLIMSILMGITLSFFLSLMGNIISGHFTLQGWIISFLLSLVISLIIGFLVPMKKVNDHFCGRYGLAPGKISTKCVESLISDLIYTPVITIAMVVFAYISATSHGAQIPLLPMLLSSLIVCLAVGFVLIFIFQPLYLKMLMKNV